MVKIRKMYWKEIPVQIEFSSSSTKKSVKLDERFQHAVDSISMKDGSYGSDDYLEGWQWVDKEEINQEFTEEQVEAGDLTQDGGINIQDVILIINIIF